MLHRDDVLWTYPHVVSVFFLLFPLPGFLLFLKPFQQTDMHLPASETSYSKPAFCQGIREKQSSFESKALKPACYCFSISNLLHMFLCGERTCRVYLETKFPYQLLPFCILLL